MNEIEQPLQNSNHPHSQSIMLESRYKMALPSCQICTKPYDIYYHVPRVLPKCGHTYCQKCIKSKLQQKRSRLTFTCPECASETVIRKNVADELPKNITIADLVKDHKYKNMDLNQQSDLQGTCKQHNKKREMVCLSCGGTPICPHCAVFGEHKGHNIGSEMSATKEDMNDLKQFISVIEDTVNQLLLPDAPANIQKQCKSKLIDSLQQHVKDSFKFYYAELSRRQSQLLEQCETIIIDENGQDCIDSILASYDFLKIRAQEVNSNTPRSQIEEIIESAKDLHSEIQKIVNNFNRSVDVFLEQAKAKIKQVAFFQLESVQKRSLKAILKGQRSPENKTKLKESTKGLQIKRQDMNINRSRLSKEKEVSPIGRKKTQSFLTDKIQNKPKLITVATPASRIKTQKLIPKQAIETNPNPNTNPNSNYNSRNGDAGEIKKNTNTIQNQSDASRVIKNGKGSVKKHEGIRSPQKNGQKDRSPIKLINQNVDLKFTKPTKQLNYEYRSKFQSIIAEIQRQHPEGTLELIGLEICDILIPHICEYLQSRKLRFSMIKLVKNMITDEGFKVLLSYLSTDTYTKVLNLTSNQITQKCFPWIVHFIGLNNICKMIYLSNNKISQTQLKKIQPSLDSKFMQVLL